MEANKVVLVTGVAGFIGFHLSLRLLNQGFHVFGIDNLNTYYDVELKKARLRILEKCSSFQIAKIDISDRFSVDQIFQDGIFENVFHLAAEAGVRQSSINPYPYLESNLTGFLNILEGCRKSEVKHFIFASSSSVYGATTKVPFSEEDNTDFPLSFYGATKKANEVIAHSYAHLHGLPCTGLRFFTVYGPWGRPDMAIYRFTQAVDEGKPIEIYNYGRMDRDFTYIDDIVEGIVRVSSLIPRADSDSSSAPYSVYNIGNGMKVSLAKIIECIEYELGKNAEKKYLPMQAGDVVVTLANVQNLFGAVGFKPQTPIEAGIANFVRWYKSYIAERQMF